MNARTFGAAGIGKAPNRPHRGQKGVFLERHRRGQKRGYALHRIVGRKPQKPLRLPIGKVLAHGAVGMDVHKSRHHIPAGGVHIRIAFQLADGGDPAVKLYVRLHKGPAHEHLCMLNPHAFLLIRAPAVRRRPSTDRRGGSGHPAAAARSFRQAPGIHPRAPTAPCQE